MCVLVCSARCFAATLPSAPPFLSSSPPTDSAIVCPELTRWAAATGRCCIAARAFLFSTSSADSLGAAAELTPLSASPTGLPPPPPPRASAGRGPRPARARRTESAAGAVLARSWVVGRGSEAAPWVGATALSRASGMPSLMGLLTRGVRRSAPAPTALWGPFVATCCSAKDGSLESFRPVMALASVFANGFGIAAGSGDRMSAYALA
mmetsp:Transcript_49568/g.120238  ORF Transcript_49568/g.120238 Transcript_49568/m.120238 type:complete len:208 (-) Transcript_49568:410-1033(-)